MKLGSYRNKVRTPLGLKSISLGNQSNDVHIDDLYQGVIACVGNPNYPAAKENMYWRVSSAGKIGGASGVTVEAGDSIVCIATNAGGTEAAVGTSFMILQKNITAATLTIFRAGTSTSDFVTPKNLADNGFTFSAATPLAIAGGTTQQLSLTSSAAAGALTISATALTTGRAIDITASVAGVALNVINMSLGLFSGLTADAVAGFRMNTVNLASDTDTSSVTGFLVESTGVTGSRSDMIGFAANVAGVLDTADTHQGVLVGHTASMNNASATTYGLRIACQAASPYAFTHTNGTYYGIHINHTAQVVAGAAYGLNINMGRLDNSATITTRAINVTTSTVGAEASLYTSVAVAQTMTGASAVNMVETARFSLTTAVQMGNWANTIVGKMDLSTTGYVTGLAGVVCAELNMPSTAPAGSAGTYACFEAEINMACITTVPVSAFYMSVWGTNVAAFDDYGFVMDISGLSMATAHCFQANNNTASHALRIRVNGVPYYILLSDTSD